MRSPFLDRVQQQPLIADGAIGTQMHERGVPWGRSLDEVTLTDRQLVFGVHVDYLRAGAELITTNTFASNRIKLAEYQLQERVRDLNMHAVKVAREAREVTGVSAFVAGAVGPATHPGLQPVASSDVALIRDVFGEQVSGLLEGGADVILLETFADIREIEIAIEACRATCDLPVIASMTFDADRRTSGDVDPDEAARRLVAAGVDVVGINCSVGPQGALDMLLQMREAIDSPICVMPNAGLPSRRGSQSFLYMSTPEYFADYARRFVTAGAAIVGGCCGTTPRHTSAMVESLADCAGRAPAVQVREPGSAPAPVSEVVPPAQPTRLAESLQRGEFVVSVELAPPKGVNPEKVLAGAKMLEQRGLRFVNVTDSAMARVRMGSIAVAKLVQDCTSMESIIHYTTRDRNLMALQSELLGAHAMGVRNVLALTGDPPGVGDYPDATGVWDVESPGLVEALNKMNAGTDLRGRDIGGAANFCVGCAVNPTAEDLDLELDRFARKMVAGAHFVMSQPLYDMATLEQFLERVGAIPAPFLLGILPLQSLRHAEYMHNEVPGIHIPRRLQDAMADAGASGIAKGIELAQEFVAEAQSFVDGIYLMPSFGRYEICGEVLQALDSDRDPASAGARANQPVPIS